MQIDINTLAPEVAQYIEDLKAQNNELQQRNELLKKNINESFTEPSEDKEEIKPFTEETDEWFGLGDIAYELFCRENVNTKYNKSEIMRKRDNPCKDYVLDEYQRKYNSKYEKIRARLGNIFKIVFLDKYKEAFRVDGEYKFNKKGRDFIIRLCNEYSDSEFWQYFDYLLRENEKGNKKKNNKEKFINLDDVTNNDDDLTDDNALIEASTAAVIIDIRNLKEVDKDNNGLYLAVYKAGVISDEVFIDALCLINDGFTDWYSSLHPNPTLSHGFNLYIANVTCFYTIYWLHMAKITLYNNIPTLVRPIPKYTKKIKFFGFEYSPFYMEEYISFITEKSKELTNHIIDIADSWNNKKSELDLKQTELCNKLPQKQDLYYFVDTIIDLAYAYFKAAKEEQKHEKIAVISETEREEDVILKIAKEEAFTTLLCGELSDPWTDYRKKIFDGLLNAIVTSELAKKKYDKKFIRIRRCKLQRKQRRRYRKFYINR